MTTPDPLAELRARPGQWRHAAESDCRYACGDAAARALEECAADLDRILSRLGEARVMYGRPGHDIQQLIHAPAAITFASPGLRPHLVIPIKEPTDATP